MAEKKKKTGFKVPTSQHGKEGRAIVLICCYLCPSGCAEDSDNQDGQGDVPWKLKAEAASLSSIPQNVHAASFSNMEFKAGRSG